MHRLTFIWDRVKDILLICRETRGKYGEGGGGGGGNCSKEHEYTRIIYLYSHGIGRGLELKKDWHVQAFSGNALLGSMLRLYRWTLGN